MEVNMSASHPPAWEVLLLVAHYLDPKTLAMASCVCKSWSVCMSSDHLWKPICFTHYPSLSTLRLLDSAVSYHRLFALGQSSCRRRLRSPSVPHISLDHLIFTMDIIHGDSNILTLVKSGSDLNNRWNGVFRFDIELHGGNRSIIEMSEEVRVTWTVVLKGWRGVFSMMDRKEKGRLVAAGERWFSEELPSLGCCSNAVSSSLVAELGLGFSYASDGDKKRRVEKVSMGILSVVSWGYLGIDDGLRYLQHFLLPDAV
ncbi:PREDICTED: probable F-box protein At5g04010 [Nelumbo nucifera]|uniref:F-box protein n=2 Tax=Nelumbo nucifera TaxID=4432 RepID=A0A822YAR0_NELNU|nr:PREDICTED: probable F-box protein At5g04010 [Nelumbo nucifera]DAD29517.1 TPA_asm: hypothetical protein HUJ06_030985 [Nelumbo nucifera]